MGWQARSCTGVGLQPSCVVFPEVDWDLFMFAFDDSAGLLRKATAHTLATALCLLLLPRAPHSTERRLLAEINTWLGFVTGPK